MDQIQKTVNSCVSNQSGACENQWYLMGHLINGNQEANATTQQMVDPGSIPVLAANFFSVLNSNSW